jgi:hypothetical protein
VIPWQVLASVLALMLLVTGSAAPGSSSQARAQSRPSVLTAVGTDGTLRALEGDHWVTIWPDIGHGATVSGLAWHPSRPELLVVRATPGDSDEAWPSPRLVRIDLTTGVEEVIVDGVDDPEEDLVGPRYAPDGRSAMARLDYYGGDTVVQFGVPPADIAPTRWTVNNLFARNVRAHSVFSIGPYAPDGRIMMSVICCMVAGGTASIPMPEDDPGGLYLVDPDLKLAQKVKDFIYAEPVGVAPDGAWIVLLAPTYRDNHGPSLVALDLQNGTSRTLLQPTHQVSAVTDVAPDGRVAIVQHDEGSDGRAPPGTLWIVDGDGSSQQVRTDDLPDLTAFAWAGADVVQRPRALQRDGHCVLVLRDEQRCVPVRAQPR